MLQSVERNAGLNCGEHVGGRQCEPGQAERIGGAGLLRWNHAAARPLVATVIAGECDRADHAIAIDDGRPHVEVESTVGLVSSGDQSGFEGRMARQFAAFARVASVSNGRLRLYSGKPQNQPGYFQSKPLAHDDSPCRDEARNRPPSRKRAASGFLIGSGACPGKRPHQAMGVVSLWMEGCDSGLNLCSLIGPGGTPSKRCWTRWRSAWHRRRRFRAAARGSGRCGARRFRLVQPRR